MLARMNRYLSFLLVAALPVLSACSTVVVEPASGQRSYVAAAAHAPARARTPVPGGSYVVAKGDTMYSIAFRNGVDFRDLAKWNGIAAPYTIWPGQKLRLSPPTGGVAVAGVGHARASVASGRSPAPTAPVFENAPVPAPPSTAAAASTTAAPRPAAAALPATPSPAPKPLAASGGSHEAGGVTWRWPADGQVIKRFTPGDAVPGIEIAGKAGDPVRAAADGVVVYSGNGLVGYGELVIIKHNDSLLSAYGHNSKRLVTEGQRVSAGQVIARMGSSGASRVELSFQIRKDGNPVDPMSYLPAK